jgi:hypothetical protein
LTAKSGCEAAKIGKKARNAAILLPYCERPKFQGVANNWVVL